MSCHCIHILLISFRHDFGGKTARTFLGYGTISNI